MSDISYSDKDTCGALYTDKEGDHVYCCYRDWDMKRCKLVKNERFQRWLKVCDSCFEKLEKKGVVTKVYDKELGMFCKITTSIID
jgi:L-rhamnose mutarotase